MLYDKRKLKRFDLFLIVEFSPLKRPAERSIGITRNLSCGGFSLETQEFDFEQGEILQFDLKHPRSEVAVSALGEVVWKKQGWYKYIAGIKLYDVDEKVKSKILELIFAVRDMSYESLFSDGAIEDISDVDKKEPAVTVPAQTVEETVIDESGSDKEGKDTPPPPGADTEEALKKAALDGGEAVGETGAQQTGAAPVPESVGIPDAPGEAPPDKRAEPDEAKPAYADASDGRRGWKSKKILIYIPAIMIVAVIIVIALPVVLENYSKDIEDLSRRFTDPTSPQEMEGMQTGNQSLQERFEQSQEQIVDGNIAPAEPDQAADTEHLVVRGGETGDITDYPPVRGLIEEGKEQQLIPPVEVEEVLKPEPAVRQENALKSAQTAKAAKPLKTEPVSDNAKTPKTGPVVKNENPRGTEQVTKIKKTPKPAESRSKATEPVQLIKSKQPPKAKSSTKTEKVGKTDIASESGGAPQKVLKVKPAAKSDKPEPVIKAVKTAKHEAVVKSKQTVVTETAEKSVQPKDAEPVIKAEKVSKPEPASGTEKAPQSDPILKEEKPETDVKIEDIPEPALIAKTEPSGEGGSTMDEGLASGAETAESGLAATVKEPQKAEDLLKKEESPRKAGPAIKQRKLPKIALLVTRKKPLPENNLFQRWKHIGSIKNGISLFIDSGTVSYKSQHIVELSMKASADKKEFVDLIEIDCSKIKLRIVKEGIEKNPALSPYSPEWTGILPEGMILYNAVCPKNIRK